MTHVNQPYRPYSRWSRYHTVVQNTGLRDRALVYRVGQNNRHFRKLQSLQMITDKGIPYAYTKKCSVRYFSKTLVFCMFPRLNILCTSWVERCYTETRKVDNSRCTASQSFLALITIRLRESILSTGRQVRHLIWTVVLPSLRQQLAYRHLSRFIAARTTMQKMESYFK